MLKADCCPQLGKSVAQCRNSDHTFFSPQPMLHQHVSPGLNQPFAIYKCKDQSKQKRIQANFSLSIKHKMQPPLQEQ